MSVSFTETKPRYQIGQILPITATFASGGANVSPSVVSVTVQDGTGVQTSPTPSNPSTGVYTINLSLTSSGVWTVRWSSTGTYQAAYEFSFEVGRSVILGE